MRVLLTGAYGQLGSELQQVLSHDELIRADLPEFDLSDSTITRKVIEQGPEVIIHAGANTDVDGCERDPDGAFRVNTEGTRRVAEAAAQLGAILVYLSTDYVFDGTKHEPYEEGDPTSPVNAYGRSKLMGEREVLGCGAQALIVRTSWLYGRYGKNFVKTILGLAARQEEVRVVDDQRGSPTYARELAAVIVALLHQGARGIIHAGGEGACSWYEFAGAIVEEAQIRCRVTPIATAEAGRLALRPPYSVLSTIRLHDYGIHLSPWRVALKRFLHDYALAQNGSRSG
jgi:dTDP-4-dehydrorhamnose reductase